MERTRPDDEGHAGDGDAPDARRDGTAEGSAPSRGPVGESAPPTVTPSQSTVPPERAAALPWWEQAGTGGASATGRTVPAGAADGQPDTGGLPPGPDTDGPSAGPAPRRRRVRALVIVLVALLLATAATVAWLQWPPSTPDAVAEAAADVRGWDGVTYRARLTQPGTGPVDVELTSDGSGDVYGTLTRPGGGRAEYARVSGTEVLKGASDWWRPEKDGAVKASRLSGYWVTPPAAVTAWLAPAVPPSVTGLAGDLTGAGGAPPAYAEPGEREIDGAPGRVVSWPGREIVLSGGPEPRLLSVVPAGSPDPTGIRAARPAPGAVGAVGRGPDRVSDARSYDSLLYAPGAVDPVTRQLPDCFTPQCPTPFELVNSGGFEARGTAVLVVDGTESGRVPFRLAAGARRGFELSFVNRAIQQGRDRVDVSYRIRIDPLP
ncbi:MULTISPECIES: hypothetical protein [unclassified Pseudonocardia]|uniref:hypothetical protein n=1 Tax=unclassified Pseudonocardia TaxID=2619320 RepID=UPI00094ABA4D|nr:hypothetical protein [Pseudonocardia sp. Ae707_Ps1]OLM20451.1 hypothetical protein Ae707Ps1_4710c [Pseudonocardia sp. Ae707_Ps1]